MCIDIDECAQVPNGGCHELRNCTNTLVSWSSLSLPAEDYHLLSPPLLSPPPLTHSSSSPLPPHTLLLSSPPSYTHTLTRSHTHRVVSSVGLASLAMLRMASLGASFLILVQLASITVRKWSTASIQEKDNFTVRWEHHHAPQTSHTPSHSGMLWRQILRLICCMCTFTDSFNPPPPLHPSTSHTHSVLWDSLAMGGSVAQTRTWTVYPTPTSPSAVTTLPALWYALALLAINLHTTSYETWPFRLLYSVLHIRQTYTHTQLRSIMMSAKHSLLKLC